MSDNPYSVDSGWVDLPPGSSEIAADAAAKDKAWEPIGEQPDLLHRAWDWISNKVQGQRQYDYPQIGPAFGQRAQDLVDKAKTTTGSAAAIAANPRSNLLDADKQQYDYYNNVSNGMVAAQDTPGQIDIIRKNFPKARFTSDAFGNVVANINGERFYLNPKGLTQTDVGQAANEALYTAVPGVGLAKLGKYALGGFGRVLGATTGTALGDAGVQAQARGLGSETPIGLERAAGVGLMSGAGEAVIPPSVQFFKNIFGSPQYYRNGALTTGGIQAFRDAGIDPSRITPEMAEHFGALTRGSLYGPGSFYPTTDPAAAARQAEAQTLTSPTTLTTGQATRGPSLVQEVRPPGQAAADILAKNTQLQNQNLIQSGQQLQDQIAGGTATVGPPGTGALDAQQALLQKRQGLQQTMEDAYDKARDQGSMFPTGPVVVKNDAVTNLTKQMQSATSTFDPKANPKIQSVIDDLPAGNSGPVKDNKGTFIPRGVDFKDLEQWRDRTVKTMDSLRDPTQKSAIQRVLDTYDTAVETSIKNDLRHGSPDVVDLWKDARGIRSKFNDLFQKGDLIQELTYNGKLAANPDEAVNYVFGRGQIGARAGLRDDLVKMRDMLGQNSPEWSAIREEGFLRLMRGQDPASGKFNSTAFNRNLDSAFGSNQAAMDVMFNKAEQNAFKQLGNVAKNINAMPPAQAMQALPKLDYVALHLGRLGPVAVSYIRMLGQTARQTSGANAAVSGALPTVSSVPAGVGAVAGSAAAPLVPSIMPSWLGGRY